MDSKSELETFVRLKYKIIQPGYSVDDYLAYPEIVRNNWGNRLKDYFENHSISEPAYNWTLYTDWLIEELCEYEKNYE